MYMYHIVHDRINGSTKNAIRTLNHALSVEIVSFKQLTWVGDVIRKAWQIKASDEVVNHNEGTGKMGELERY